MSDKPSFVTAWTQPESAANTDYQPVFPYNNVTQTPGGHSFELDDTPTRERIRLQHTANTFIEMQPNGDEVHKIYGDGYHIVLGDNNIQIGIDDGNKAKKLNITVYGDAYMYVAGDKIEQIDGNVEQHIKGNFSQIIEGRSRITSLGNMSITGGASALGTLTIGAGDSVRFNSDVGVIGSVVADQVSAKRLLEFCKAGPFVLRIIRSSDSVEVAVLFALALGVHDNLGYKRSTGTELSLFE